MPKTTLELHAPMPYDKACAECGQPVTVVVTVRDWAGKANGFPTDHPLCKTCAVRLRALLDQFLTEPT